MSFGERNPTRLDEFVSIERDPFSTQRGQWISISDANVGTEHGVYCGMTHYGSLVLNPYLLTECEPRIPQAIREFSILNRPAYMPNTPSVKITPIRKEQIDRVCTPLSPEELGKIDRDKKQV